MQQPNRKFPTSNDIKKPCLDSLNFSTLALTLWWLLKAFLLKTLHLLSLFILTCFFSQSENSFLQRTSSTIPIHLPVFSLGMFPRAGVKCFSTTSYQYCSTTGAPPKEPPSWILWALNKLPLATITVLLLLPVGGFGVMVVAVFQSNVTKIAAECVCLSTKELPNFKWIGPQVQMLCTLEKTVSPLNCFQPQSLQRAKELPTHKREWRWTAALWSLSPIVIVCKNSELLLARIWLGGRNTIALEISGLKEKHKHLLFCWYTSNF